MPYLSCKGCRDERDGFEEYAYQKGSAGAVETGGEGCDRGDNEGLRDGEAADEGEFEAGSAREDVVGEVILRSGYKISECQMSKRIGDSHEVCKVI
jgi:hypothetical protein